MTKTRNDWARLSITGAARTFLAVIALTMPFGFVEVNNVLRPPRRVLSGALLARWKAPYQPVDFSTEDGVYLSAWHTPIPWRNSSLRLDRTP
ncbi:MAG: hypothetical protein WA821_05315 [Anaerolineales bacterium]